MSPRHYPAEFAASPYEGDGWALTARGAALALAQTPPVFALGDGFLGLRGPGDLPGAPRAYLNGVFEETAIPYHEAAYGYARSSDTRVAVADATDITVLVDGAEPALIAVELDLAGGVLRATRAAEGVRVTHEILVALARRGVVATRVRLEADRPARVQLSRAVAPPPAAAGEAGGIYDPRIAPATAASWREERAWADGETVGRVDRLARSGFAVAAVAQCLDPSFDLAAGEERAVEGLAAYAADRGGDPLPAARAALDQAAIGFGALAAEQRAWLDRFWRDAHVELSDATATTMLRHGLFQLIQAAGRDGATSLSAKGQTGEGYEGHVFWDAETYALPVFVYLAPALARAMLRWRIGGLDAARANARLLGHARGALYPWRTIAGAECSSFFPAGAAQYHLNADIAHALRLYVATTGDRSILDEGGAAMLAETARLWLDTGFHDPDRGGAFVINRVTGPDEYSALVDNNLYTNLLAAEHLRFAAAEGGVDADEAAAMRRAADAMHLPHDAEADVPAQDDGFFALEPWPFAATPDAEYPLLLHHHPLSIYRRRVCKQADAVLAAAMLPAAFDRATRRRMLDVYERYTVHDSTLSASAFAILAARVGETARAAAYWRTSVLTDLGDLFGNSGHGLHMAALAGGWNALAMGFTGLDTLDGTLRFAPAPLPDGDYALRLRFQGRLVEVAVDGAGVRYTLLDGDTVALVHDGEELTLTPSAPVARGHAA